MNPYTMINFLAGIGLLLNAGLMVAYPTFRPSPIALACAGILILLNVVRIKNALQFRYAPQRVVALLSDASPRM